uniref:Uncharacterized protein n=1 Tax=Romanomermis culicivorax TaxID=13658 RepID=A0A915JCE1_ROMCU
MSAMAAQGCGGSRAQHAVASPFKLNTTDVSSSPNAFLTNFCNSKADKGKAIVSSRKAGIPTKNKVYKKFEFYKI